MLKKIPIPKRYTFFASEKAMQKIFSEKRDNFFPNSRGIFIEKIDCSSLRLGGVLKIFIKYLVRIQYANKTEQRLLYGIRRFNGTSYSEFLILQYLWKNSISAKNLLINRPLCFFSQYKLILYEELVGDPLNEKIKQLPPRKTLRFLEPVASLIALLHAKGGGAPFKVQNSLQKEKKKAALFLKDFVDFYPSRGKEIKHLIERIFFLKSRIIRRHKKTFALIHNDLTLGNIVFQEKTKKLGVIDFSESCTYDPFIDVGTFLSQVDYLGHAKNIHPADIREFKQSFIKRYLRQSGKKQKTVNERLNTYQAWGAIQNAIFTLAPAEKNHNTVLAEKFIKDARNYISKL